MFQYAFYNTKDLCQIFKVNRSTIHRWIREGRLAKPKMLGCRSPRWSQEQINQFIK
jgi:excisionase family DNA binding protein